MLAAREVGYKPDLYASNLRSKKSRNIAVIVPEIVNSFFSLAIEGIESIARANNYHVLIYLSHESYQNEVAIIQHLLNGRVDGVLLSLASDTLRADHIEQLKSKKIPVVMFDSESSNR